MGMEPAEMIGKLVRWESDGQWLVARITGKGSGAAGSLAGEVVDPGNYTGLSSFAPKESVSVGDTLPNLLPDLITVIDEGGSSC
jgi:hypothetical protein